MSDNNGGGGFVLGLFVGGVIGAMIGLLMAPKAGSQTRADIREIGDTWRSRADEMAAEMRARGLPDLGYMSERVGPAVDSLKQRGSSTVGAVRSRMGVGDVEVDASQPVAEYASQPVAESASQPVAESASQPVAESGENGTPKDSETA